MAGIYVHIPFCKQACHYCDFHFSTDMRNAHELVGALNHEIELQKDYLNHEPIETIYFGGGTPSLLSKRELSSVLESIHRTFSVRPDRELTIEVNPDDLSREKIKDLQAMGFNRLSIGVQSFDDEILKFLNRAHDAAAARNSIEDAHTAGFNNLSIDLMYAIPGLTDHKWEETLAEAAHFFPEHISTYALTIEERTVFGHKHKHGKLSPVDDEMAATQYETLMATLGKSGYEHYEISNFSRPGFVSRHNSNYWNDTPYLGLGPSAHSYDLTSRQSNARSNSFYVKSLASGTVPYQREVLSRENKINEYILTRLRTMWGCNLRVLKDRWDDDLRRRQGDYLIQLLDHGLLVIEGDILTLTPKGKLVADKIAGDLVIDS